MSATTGFPGTTRDDAATTAGALVREQHPDLAGLATGAVHRGWSNTVVRLGDHLAVRLPHRAETAHRIGVEQRALGSLGPLSVPTPRPHRIGHPSAPLGYPWRWSVVPWLPGTMAATSHVDDLAMADDLADFLVSLHHPAPDDFTDNPARSGVVATHRARIVTRLRGPGIPPTLDAATLVAAVDAANGTRWAGPPCWVHGDLHGRNLLVDRGRLAGVLDFGDVHVGDPAVDLLPAWMVLRRAGRARLRRRLHHVDDATWMRGRAWAVHLAAWFASERDELFHTVGLAALRAVADDVTRG